MIAEKSAHHRPKLLDQVRERIRLKHQSIRTEKIYLAWIRRFILFHDKRNPRDMGKVEVEAFLTHPFGGRRSSCSVTQNQALNALLFFYKGVKGTLRRAGIRKKASCHTLRHSFATHPFERGNDIRTVRELLGHKSVQTMMIYTHVLKLGGRGVVGPLDA